MNRHNDDGHLYDLSSPLRQQLRLAARLALGISLFALLVLLVTLYYLFSGETGSYYQVIASLTRSQEHLITAMLFGGAIIVFAGGLVLWSIILYSSARIAGPLYRFSRNVEMEINEGPVQPVQLRKGDHLQALSEKLADAALGLRQHYDVQLEALDKLETALQEDERGNLSSVAYRELVNQLKETAARH
jgi:hypothetical protein